MYWGEYRFLDIVYNEHKKYKENEKKLSKTLAFP